MTSNQIQQDAENDPQIFRVVVINDNHVQCQMLAGLLRREQLDAQTFLSAEAALESMMRIGAPHLIITDLYMPGIDGWRFCRLLRSSEYALLNQVPILVVSATYSGDETTRITNDLGANAFLLMPVDGEVFIKQVHALLRGEQPQEALHVLIVENSKLTSASLVNKFQEYGYLTDAAFTLQEGITMLGQKTYDIAVLDHHLPDGQGDALLKIAQDKSPGCVCMMMSAETQADLALTWMKNGAGAYLHVPFTPDYLIAQCERARRERALLRVQELLNIRTCQLRESEEKYRNLVNYSSDPIFSFNPDETYHFVNEAFARSFGKNPEDIIGKTPHAIFPYDEAEKRLTLVRHVFKTGEKGEIESKVITHAGDERYYLTLADPIKDVQEKVLYVACTSKDITTRKRAEESLRESEKRFNLALEGTDAGIWDWDMLNDQVVYSARWKSMLGYTDDEVENSFSGWKNLWHPEDGARIEKAIAEYLTGETKHYEIIHRCRHKDGDWRWILTRGATLKDAAGKPYRWIGTNLDITKHKLVEEELWKSESQKNAILNGITTNIALVDKELKILWANKAAANSVNKQSDDMVGHLCYTFWGDSNKPCANCPTIMAFQSGKSEHKIVQTPDGRIWNESGEPVFDTEGNVITVVEIAQDITETKQAEAKINEQLEELRRWYNITLGREERIYQLKNDINQLLTETGKPQRYASTAEAAHE